MKRGILRLWIVLPECHIPPALRKSRLSLPDTVSVDVFIPIKNMMYHSKVFEQSSNMVREFR